MSSAYWKVTRNREFPIQFLNYPCLDQGPYYKYMFYITLFVEVSKQFETHQMYVRLA